MAMAGLGPAAGMHDPGENFDVVRVTRVTLNIIVAVFYYSSILRGGSLTRMT